MKTTLLHFIAEVVCTSAPELISVKDLLPFVSEAARVPLEELTAKLKVARLGLEQVDGEVSWHDDQQVNGKADAEDQFLDVLTEFYNWASERLDVFEQDLQAASEAFKDLYTGFGEDELKEPAELFETLEKFLVRFEAACKEADDARKEAERSQGVRKPLHKQRKPLPGGARPLQVKKAGSGCVAAPSGSSSAGSSVGGGSPRSQEESVEQPAAERPAEPPAERRVLGGGRGKRLSGAASFLQSRKW